MADKIKRKYETLRKKHKQYKLPEFEELDSEFEISRIEHEGFLLREIRKKISEKIGDIAGMLERMLQPEANLADLYESRVFGENEKKRMFELYKRLMAAERQAAELSILNDKQLDVNFIKSFLMEWKKLKPELANYIRALKEAWEKETEEGETAGYMG